MTDFYEDSIRKGLDAGMVRPDMRILVIAGGERDKEVLQRCGFTDVTISNLDERMSADAFAPYEWSFQDAEQLTYDDDAFDVAIIHEGLHHCYSPHRGLLEAYRVARKGVFMLEPKDNILTRAGQALGFGQTYEHAAVFYNDCRYGGVGNSRIPNYIYRWTEPEVRKTIHTYAPYGTHRFLFINRLVLPVGQLKGRRNKVYFLAVRVAFPVLRLLDRLLPSFGNNMAAWVVKPTLPDDLHPWLVSTSDGIGLNTAWLEQRYTSRPAPESGP